MNKKYTLRMRSKVEGTELNEYTVYAVSEEEAIKKLSQLEFSKDVVPLEDFEFTDHIKDLPETIEIVSCEECDEELG